MNNPHQQNLLNDQQDDGQQDDMFEVTPSFLAFSRKVYQVWKGSGTDPQKAEQIRVLALSALAARDEDDEDDDSHTDGPEIRQHRLPNTQGSRVGFDRIEDGQLESDAMGLAGAYDELLDRTIKPRKMSKAELQAAADRLTGGHSVEDDVLEAAVNRRLARGLMSAHSSGYHR